MSLDRLAVPTNDKNRKIKQEVTTGESRKGGNKNESENSIKDHFHTAYCSRIDLREIHNNINSINIGLFANSIKVRFDELEGVKTMYQYLITYENTNTGDNGNTTINNNSADPWNITIADVVKQIPVDNYDSLKIQLNTDLTK